MAAFVVVACIMQSYTGLVYVCSQSATTFAFRGSFASSFLRSSAEISAPATPALVGEAVAA